MRPLFHILCSILLIHRVENVIESVNKEHTFPEEDLCDVLGGDDLQPQPHVQQDSPHCHTQPQARKVSSCFGPPKLKLIDYCSQCGPLRPSRAGHKDVNGTKSALSNGRDKRQREINQGELKVEDNEFELSDTYTYFFAYVYVPGILVNWERLGKLGRTDSTAGVSEIDFCGVPVFCFPVSRLRQLEQIAEQTRT